MTLYYNYSLKLSSKSLKNRMPDLDNFLREGFNEWSDIERQMYGNHESEVRGEQKAPVGENPYGEYTYGEYTYGDFPR
jgi:hypothetical protein